MRRAAIILLFIFGLLFLATGIVVYLFAHDPSTEQYLLEQGYYLEQLKPHQIVLLGQGIGIAFMVIGGLLTLLGVVKSVIRPTPRVVKEVEVRRGRPWWQWCIIGFMLMIILTMLIGSGREWHSMSGMMRTMPSPPGPPVTYQFDRSFEVEAGEQEIIAVYLDRGEILQGYFTIDGGNDDIDFYVEDPFEEQVLNPRRVDDEYDFSIGAEFRGFYILHFDNGFSFFDKGVHLRYNTT